MDLLSQHEAFLRAIFDAPDDDTPRLVYADFLQENGEVDRAELIRVQCELAIGCADAERRTVLTTREAELLAKVVPWDEPAFMHGCSISRGFWHEEIYGGIELTIENLERVVEWRALVVRKYPSWYGEKRLAVRSKAPLLPDHIDQMWSVPFLQQVTEWNLAGHIHDHSTAPVVDQVGDFEGLPRMTGFHIAPAVTKGCVNFLAWHRCARRITSLDLRNNYLDNDVARALVKSPYLDNLKRLELYDGNQFRGRVWQQVIERFGEDVVG